MASGSIWNVKGALDVTIPTYSVVSGWSSSNFSCFKTGHVVSFTFQGYVSPRASTGVNETLATGLPAPNRMVEVGGAFEDRNGTYHSIAACVTSNGDFVVRQPMPFEGHQGYPYFTITYIVDD